VAAGSGLATGTAIVFVWPITGGARPHGGSVADWTALLIGVLVTRPVVFGLAVGLVCAGIWHVSLSQRSFDLSLPVACGVGGAVVFTFGDLLAQPSGTRTELAWHVIAALGLAIAARVVFGRGLAHDRAVSVAAGRRVVCPNCASLTPAGQFCAICGAPLARQSPVSGTNLTERVEIVPAEDVDEPATEEPTPR
jgi:hypothetical protein